MNALQAAALRRPALVAAISGLLVSFGAYGCSSSNNGSGSGSGAVSGTTFTEVYVTVIGPSCTTHHSGAAPSGNLDMSTQAAAYKNLVGAKAAGPGCGTSGETRVVAGSSATSLLYQKVAGTQTCGEQMPLGRPALAASDVALVKAWIDDGAKND